jgi:hypothetical protein
MIMSSGRSGVAEACWVVIARSQRREKESVARSQRAVEAEAWGKGRKSEHAASRRADRHIFLAKAYGATFCDCLHGNMRRTLAQYANVPRQAYVLMRFLIEPDAISVAAAE